MQNNKQSEENSAYRFNTIDAVCDLGFATGMLVGGIALMYDAVANRRGQTTRRDYLFRTTEFLMGMLEVAGGIGGVRKYTQRTNNTSA
jgi:hypothetical protein